VAWPQSAAAPSPRAQSGGRHRVLVAATVHWASTARLCLSLARAGLEVGTVTPPHHRVRELDGIAANFTCSPHAGATAAIARAIEAWSPELVIPCDDPALYCLHELHGQAGGAGRDPGLDALLRASLGDPASFPTARRKSDFTAFAREQGIAVPHTVVVRSLEGLRAELRAARLPQVLKLDGSWGGLGVRIVHSAPEAERAFLELGSLSSWPNAAKGAVKALSLAPLRHRFKGRMPTITMQDYVDGRPANRAVLCWEGEILAGLSVEALQTFDETGPATVVRAIERRDMAEAAAQLVRQLRLSGFVGFDFILEAGSGRAILLEMNARPTPICHLVLSSESDLVGALAARLTGTAPRRPASPIDSEVIALFPQELWRDPGSRYLRSCFHDVPWDEPKFVGAYVLPVPQHPASWIDGLQGYRRQLRSFGGWLRGRTASDPLAAPALRTGPTASSLDPRGVLTAIAGFDAEGPPATGDPGRPG
jgi:hypothetical protein